MAFAYGVMDPVDLDKPLPHSTRFARFRPTGADSHPGTGSPGPDAKKLIVLADASYQQQ